MTPLEVEQIKVDGGCRPAHKSDGLARSELSGKTLQHCTCPSRGLQTKMSARGLWLLRKKKTERKIRQKRAKEWTARSNARAVLTQRKNDWSLDHHGKMGPPKEGQDGCRRGNRDQRSGSQSDWAKRKCPVCYPLPEGEVGGGAQAQMKST